MGNRITEEHEAWLKNIFGITIEELENSSGDREDRLIGEILCEEAYLMDVDEKECKIVSDILDYISGV